MKKKLRLGALILVLISFNIVVAKSAALSEESITLAFDEVEETETLTYDKETNDVYVTKDSERLTVTKNELEEKYINMYGPLTLCDDVGTSYKWSDNPWPWENMGGSNYV